MLIKSCQKCGQNFEIRKEDEEFYKKVGQKCENTFYPIKVPTLCAACRMQRRLAHRNERNLYKRACDFTKKNIISVYSPDKPCKVYDHEIWWSDKWDAREFGRDFDFNRPFFEQYAKLQKDVPRMSMIISHCENAEYAPYSVESRNCYMCVSVVGSEDILYSYQTNASNDCTDCALTYHSELCYECIYGVNLYHCRYTLNCRNSSDLSFCRDCQGCDRCIGCVNLKNKKLHIFNKPVSEEEFKKWASELSKHSNIEKLKKQFYEFAEQFPIRSNYNINCENCEGDHLLNCKNAYCCFEAEDLEDCAYIYTLPQGAKDCYDCHYTQKAELIYEAISGVQGYNCQCVLHSWNSKNCAYVDECFYSENLFGCIGLKKNTYCILNKQYTKKEYESLLQRIIKHMQNTKEWGEYWPMQLSLFAYNESIAHEFFPLSKEEIEKQNLKWRKDWESTYVKQTFEMPDNLQDVTDNIKSEILSCEQCDKNYRIIEKELEFYRQNNIAIPHLCPNCRHFERMKHRVKRTIFPQKCKNCQKSILTTSDDLSKKIYCENCYIQNL